MAVDLGALVQTAPDVVAVIDRDGRYLFINQAIEHAIGYAPGMLLGKTNDELMAPADAARWRAGIAAALATGTTQGIESTLDTPRGRRTFSALITKLSDTEVSVISRDITDVRVAERARDRTRSLQTLTTALSRAVARAQVLDIFVDAGRAALGAAAGSVWTVRDADTLALGADASSGDDATKAASEATIPMSAALPVCDVIRSGQPMLFESYEALIASYPAAASGTRHGASAVVPVLVDGRGLGAASFSFDTSRTFTDDDRELLLAIAGQASLALERLGAEVDRRINETMHRVASSFASELDHDRLVQRIIDELTKAVRAETGSFYPGEVHVDKDVTGSVLEVPVVSRGGVLFGRLLFRHREPLRFTEEHQRLAASIATHAAIALENAQLYRSEREHKEQLERAIERARIADRRKDEFLAMLGHELRNPLAPITTALELMDMKDIEDARKERDVIRRQVTHLSRLVDDLLDMSRITRGKIQLTKQTIEIATVLAKAIEMASPILEKRHQHLAVVMPNESALVDADATRLAQVFQNLLTNAAKYSEPRSRIELTASVSESHVIVSLRDHGVGISTELLPRLFEMFVQGERSLDRAAGGLGIGLTIARSLCELHGGTIDADSAGPGTGSTFTVTLPRSVRARVSTDRMGMPPLARPRQPATGTRVLLVDDNVDAALMLREMLSELGHELEVAHDGPTALEVAAEFKPDIAVLDIGLPVMSGYELARKLRELRGPDPLRLIAVTGYGQEADRARAREVGFDHHLIKPIELAALLALLAR